MRRISLVILLLCPMWAEAQTPCTSVVGTWREVEFVDGSGVSDRAGENLYLYTDTHYSVTILTDQSPRQPLRPNKTPGKPTDEEKITAYEHWLPFSAQAGTYRVVDGKLITKPVVAKNQTIMSSPEVTKQCVIEGDTMTQRSVDGSQRKLVRVK